MSTDDDFRQKKLDNHSTHTEFPQVQPKKTLKNMQPEVETQATKNKDDLMMWLIVTSPPAFRGTVLPIDEGLVIGRHGDIRWHDPRMSRRHALFLKVSDPSNPNNTFFAIEPYQDRNGTMVNGRRILERTLLHENDVILMGDTRFVVKVLQ